MNLQDITTDLEISKELKENGFKQDSYALKVEYRANVAKDSSKENIESTTCDKSVLDRMETNAFIKVVSVYSSPTAEELLKELPKKIRYNIKIEFDCVDAEELGIHFDDYRFHDSDYMKIKDKKLCNALAKMWLYLKKEGLLK